MIGIDYTKAGVEVRQCFAFTKKAMTAAMREIKRNRQIHGCVILSTCNRTELWLSVEEDTVQKLPEMLCSLKQLDCECYRNYLVERENETAAEHLFFLSAGMQSQIVGEDQILTQVGEAAAFAREQESTDQVLEVLFRMAVTAGKLVKTRVPMDKANFSAAHQALKFLKEQGMTLREKKCLVIGNGEMGKITALALMEEGADVTVTVRQYKSGMVKIPKDTKRMEYGSRYEYIPQCDLIFSATASPNLTITKEALIRCPRSKAQIYIDLAVPKDIEPSVKELDNIALYNIDSFHMDRTSDKMKQQFRQAEDIIRKQLVEFYDWQECRELVPDMLQIGEASAGEIGCRMEKTLKQLNLSKPQKEELQQRMDQASAKVVDKLLFALRDELDKDTLRHCVEILMQVYEKK